MTTRDFAPLMGGLLAATGTKMAPQDIETWRRLLTDIPDEALRRAMTRACCECKAFPTVALIRELAAEEQHGITGTNADVWPHVIKAVRHFGLYGKERAKEAIPPLVWRALGGDVGWEWLCDMEPRERTTAASQFRDRYRELKAAEDRDRRLPQSLRPRIDNDPVRGIPEPKAKSIEHVEEPVPLQSVPIPAMRQIPSEPEPISTEELERRRSAQIEALRMRVDSPNG